MPPPQTSVSDCHLNPPYHRHQHPHQQPFDSTFETIPPIPSDTSSIAFDTTNTTRYYQYHSIPPLDTTNTLDTTRYHKQPSIPLDTSQVRTSTPSEQHILAVRRPSPCRRRDINHVNTAGCWWWWSAAISANIAAGEPTSASPLNLALSPIRAPNDKSARPPTFDTSILERKEIHAWRLPACPALSASISP